MNQGELGDFLQHAKLLADQAGVDLTYEDTMDLLARSDAGGFNVGSTEAAFAEMFADDDDEFDVEDDDGWDDEDEWDTDDEDPEPVPSRAEEALTNDLSADLERVSQKLGRPLLPHEFEEFVQGATDQINRTGGYDPAKAGEGLRGFSDMSSDEVNDWMVQRARQLDPPDEPDPDRVYDLGNDKDFVDYAVQKLEHGVEFDAPDNYDYDEAA